MTDFLIVVLLIAVAFFIWIGYRFGREGQQAKLDAQREALRIEWDAVERCRQVDDVYFEARNAMRRAEVGRQSHRPWPSVVDGEVVEAQELRPQNCVERE